MSKIIVKILLASFIAGCLWIFAFVSLCLYGKYKIYNIQGKLCSNYGRFVTPSGKDMANFKLNDFRHLQFSSFRLSYSLNGWVNRDTFYIVFIYEYRSANGFCCEIIWSPLEEQFLFVVRP